MRRWPLGGHAEKAAVLSVRIVIIGTVLGAVLVVFGLALYPDAGDRASAALIGDANCDSIVNPLDAALILQLSAGLIGSLPCPAKGDTNGDGLTNPLDSALVLQLSAGLIDSLAPAPRPTDALSSTNTPVTPTDAPLPTNTPALPTSTPETCDLIFPSLSIENDTFCGVVTDSFSLKTILGSDEYAPLPAPTGAQFDILLMDVTNFGVSKRNVTHLSFRLRTDDGQTYTLSNWEGWTTAVVTANAHYGRPGLFDEVQPQSTISMVFVFMSPQAAPARSLERCPPAVAGCGINAILPLETPTPTPTAPTATPVLPSGLPIQHCWLAVVSYKLVNPDGLPSFPSCNVPVGANYSCSVLSFTMNCDTFADWPDYDCSFLSFTGNCDVSFSIDLNAPDYNCNAIGGTVFCSTFASGWPGYTCSVGGDSVACTTGQIGFPNFSCSFGGFKFTCG